MSHIAIRVEGLSKRYRIGEQRARYSTLRESLSHTVAAPFRRLRSTFQRSNLQPANEAHIWALKDVSFDVKHGEVIGIIGRNGAGKSTLLKILSRITAPTEGRVDLHGRVGSLLEVGTGFHPELTGRENIYLNGAILGMKRIEIAAKFDEIVAFAEIEKFIDTPVKRYSSGMYVRLAFAVAAHLDPEILLVDEVLAVGDAAFQQKCLGKMGDVAEQGRTVLFVSHRMGAIATLCPRALWLDSGGMAADGGTEMTISAYLASGAGTSDEVIWEDGYANPGVTEFSLRAVRIADCAGDVVHKLDVRRPFWIEIEYHVHVPLLSCRVGFRITAMDGIVLFTAYDVDDDTLQVTRTPGHYRNRCRIPRHLLSPGRYTLSVNAGRLGIKNFAYAENILLFDVEDMGAVGTMVGGHHRSGIIRPQLKWTCSSI